MKKTILVFLLVCPIICFAECGTERWAVKTLTDGDAAQVRGDFTDATVNDLVSPVAPSRRELLHASSSRFPAELKTYRVRAFLVGYKLEEDEDFHIVIASEGDPSITMVIEIPSPHCMPADAENSQSMRSALQAKYGKATPKFKRLNPQPEIEVTGIGFFDFIHGQTGVAKNGFELHPVRSLNFQ